MLNVPGNRHLRDYPVAWAVIVRRIRDCFVHLRLNVFAIAPGGSGIILVHLGRALVSPLKMGVKKLCSEGVPPLLKYQ